MPSKRVYEIKIWNFTSDIMAYQYEYIIAYGFEEALMEARNHEGIDKKRTIMGVKMLGDVLFDMTS